MIRPFTALCLVAACGSGLYLYSEKHRTGLLDRQIAMIVHQTDAARERTGLLRAEWALMNEPSRLQEMADKYTALKPMAPTQFVPLSELASRLPPPEAANAVTADDQTDNDSDGANPASALADAGGKTPPAQPDTASAATDANGVRTADAKHSDARTGDARTADARTADAKPAEPQQGEAKTLESRSLGNRPLQGGMPAILQAADPRPALRQVARADQRGKPARHGTPSSGFEHDGIMARGMPLPLAAPQPVRAQVYSAMAHPLAPAYRPQIVAAAPHYVGSALAGGGSLPPPIPYSGDR